MEGPSVSQGDGELRVYPVVSGHPEAIVVHCADPRFQRAFREFIRTELGLQDGQYAPIVISGAVSSLSDPMAFPKHAKVVTDLLTLFFERYPIKLVVLINHEDCGQYKRLKEAIGRTFLSHVKDMVERQKLDLTKVARLLMGLSSFQANVKLYYARFADAEHAGVVFEEIPLVKK
jgi:hypothetical protein